MTKGSYEASCYDAKWNLSPRTRIFKSEQRVERWTRSVWLPLLICIGLLNHFIYVLSFKSPCALYIVHAPTKSQRNTSHTVLTEQNYMNGTYKMMSERENMCESFFSVSRANAQNNWSVVYVHKNKRAALYLRPVTRNKRRTKKGQSRLQA